MKTRNGFVSNSSSSSFVVAFPKRPESAEEVRKLLYDDLQQIPYTYNYGDNKQYFNTLDLATTIFEDINKQKENDIKSMVESVSNGWFDERIDYEKFTDENGKIDWDKYQYTNNEIAQKVVQDFIEKNSDYKFYVFNYGDEDGSFFSELEHGDTFYNLPHIKTSYH